ncbi:hypothetical protein D7X33_14305 [Butyricicoccus sp. 1XD8-22]|nr:hypothetical protein D7X33_14305 [Butyricicoccus sp. 1XD8-22]
MKRCALNPLIGAVAAMLPTSVIAAAALALRRFWEPDETTFSGLRTFALLLLLLTAVIASRHISALARAYIEYDDFQIFFHLPDSKTRRLQWPQAGYAHCWNGSPPVIFRRVPLGLIAEFCDDGAQMPVFWAASGYRDFLQILHEKGLIV